MDLIASIFLLTVSGSGELSNTSQWRALTPSNALNTRPDLGWKSKLLHVSQFMDYLSVNTQTICGPADLILFERNAVTQEALNAISYWQGLKKPVVMGLDDAYWMLPYSNPARPFWFDRPHPSPDGEETPGGATLWLEAALRLADGLISPNRLLLHDYSHITKNSYYLQNYADKDFWLDLPRKRKQGNEVGRIVIGWGGSLSHYDSFHGSGILKAIPRIAQRHPEVLWKICGSDTRILDQMDISVYNKKHEPGVKAEDWPKIVNTFDIGLAPLFGIYDQRRSWLKGIEYALAGVPWVGTEGETYKDLSDWPLAFLGPETSDFWEQTIEDRIKNIKNERKEAIALIPQARTRFLATENLDIFADVYGKIISDFRLSREGLPNVMRINPNGNTRKPKQKIDPLPNVVRIG